MLENLAASGVLTASLAGEAFDGKQNLVEKGLVDGGADVVMAAGGASFDPLATRLADAGRTLTQIVDGIVEDFGHVGGAHDTFGEDGECLLGHRQNL